LGSNFDGEDWAIGDRLIFEDGTESLIKQEPGEQFHVWDDPTPADFEEVKRVIGVSSATGWPDLFRIAEIDQSRRQLRQTVRALPWKFGCLGILCVSVLIGLSFLIRIPLWLSSVVVGVTLLLMAACAGDILYDRARLRAAEQRDRKAA
jgi:hypothetical protein